MCKRLSRTFSQYTLLFSILGDKVGSYLTMKSVLQTFFQILDWDNFISSPTDSVVVKRLVVTFRLLLPFEFFLLSAKVWNRIFYFRLKKRTFKYFGRIQHADRCYIIDFSNLKQLLQSNLDSSTVLAAFSLNCVFSAFVLLDEEVQCIGL